MQSHPTPLLQAMFVDFGMARQYSGVCFLRYDDTNPEAEKLEYIQHIEEIVRWVTDGCSCALPIELPSGAFLPIESGQCHGEAGRVISL